MRPRSLAFIEKQRDPQVAPLAICAIWTAMGVRVYSNIGLADEETWSGFGHLADGTYLADGSILAGADVETIIAREPRMLRYGVIREDGSILPPIGIGIERQRRIGGVEITLRNDDDHFGIALAHEVFLSAKLNLTIGWRGLRHNEFMTRFQGIIQEHVLNREEFVLRAEAA